MAGHMRCGVCLILTCAIGCAQNPAPQDPVQAIVRLFDTYRIVMFGEIHECRQEYDLLGKLIRAPGFAQRVNDIVVEFGNARYQPLVDRYIAGEDVSIEQVEGAWRDTVGALGPVSPVYGEFYGAVRAVNRTLPTNERLRVLLGDPPIDWSRVRTREDVGLFLPFRDEFYASVVRYEVLAKGHRALLIMGGGHFERSAGRPRDIENELLMAFVKPYVIMAESNDSVATPSLIETKGTTLEQTADAYLYLGPRDRLTVVRNLRSTLEGTAYGKELQRRLTILFDKAPDFLPSPDAGAEQPAFPRNPTPPPPLPVLPKPRP